jgi:A/G-specific adenine glycosylase
MVSLCMRLSTGRVARFRLRLLGWHAISKRQFPWRQSEASNYVRIVVELLLQRTRAETVAAFCPSFLTRFPDWWALASADPSELEEVLKPIGLWRRRALAMTLLAQYMVGRGGQWPDNRPQLEALPAVGQYVANSVLLFIHGRREPLLDASMARLLRRYFGLSPIKADIRHDKVLHSTAYLVLAKQNPIEINWAMLDLAAAICRPRMPRCSECPLRRACCFYRNRDSGEGLVMQDEPYVPSKR